MLLLKDPTLGTLSGADPRVDFRNFKTERGQRAEQILQSLFPSATGTNSKSTSVLTFTESTDDYMSFR